MTEAELIATATALAGEFLQLGVEASLHIQS